MAFELFGVHNGLKEENRRRRLAEEVLADKHAELAAIYEHTPVLMVLVDSAYTVRKANAAAAAFAGVGPGASPPSHSPAPTSRSGASHSSSHRSRTLPS